MAIELSDPAISIQKHVKNDCAVDGCLHRSANDYASEMVSSPLTLRAPSWLTLDEAEVGLIINKFSPTHPQKAPRVFILVTCMCVQIRSVCE